MPEPGISFDDHYNEFKFQAELRGEPDAELVEAPPEDLNPYAVGHIVNHPPPDFSANVKLIDFDLPFTFFPSAYARYVPYIKYRSIVPGSHQHKSVTRGDQSYRAVALVATETLSHGDELYLNYLDEQRVCPNALSNAPDWLLVPAPEP